MPISRRMDKEDAICTHTQEYYSAIKRNEIRSLEEIWMLLETVLQSEVSQKEKSKYCIMLLICGIWKNSIDELICKAGIEPQM